nr:uncharacterized protein CI109_003769 [Kwoniella shandongensis]KAA5527798.1 hypothetical protein CI109_003769 [Kwoniella shandongensis]
MPTQCDQFVDPLIEHPDLIILLDLILLKPRVFLHLLFNRGTPPFNATVNVNPSSTTFNINNDDDDGKDSTDVNAKDTGQWKRKTQLIEDLWTLGMISIISEIAVRILSNPNESGTVPATLGWDTIVRTFGVVVIEGVTQHLTTMGLSLLALRLKGWYPPIEGAISTDGRGEKKDGRRQNFLPLLIPLTILYTSLIPLLLQLILSIWYTPPFPPAPLSSTSTSPLSSVLTHIPISIPSSVQDDLLTLERVVVDTWQSTDKIWAGTRLLGGMSAGFGLRVLLPTKAWETTGLVLGGWVVAALVGKAAEDWLGP